MHDLKWKLELGHGRSMWTCVFLCLGMCPTLGSECVCMSCERNTLLEQSVVSLDAASVISLFEISLPDSFEIPVPIVSFIQHAPFRISLRSSSLSKAVMFQDELELELVASLCNISAASSDSTSWPDVGHYSHCVEGTSLGSSPVLCWV